MIKKKKKKWPKVITEKIVEEKGDKLEKKLGKKLAMEPCFRFKIRTKPETSALTVQRHD